MRYLWPALAPLEFLEERGFLPDACRRRYRAAVEQVAELYTAWSEGVPVHLTALQHGAKFAEFSTL